MAAGCRVLEHGNGLTALSEIGFVVQQVNCVCGTLFLSQAMVMGWVLSGIDIVVQWVNSLIVALTSCLRAVFESWLPHFPLSSLQICLEKQQKVALTLM